METYPQSNSTLDTIKLDGVIALVSKCGQDLKHVGYFDKEKRVVMSAVKENGLALKHASPTLKDDREVVLAAVTQIEYFN